MESKQEAFCEVIIVVDTNIVFSGILNAKGTISNILLNSSEEFQFVAPSFLIDELKRHKSKLIKASKLTVKEINALEHILFRRIEFIDIEQISSDSWITGLELIGEVDEFDAPFVALAIELGGTIWTGDKKLHKALQNVAQIQIVNTREIAALRGQ